MKQYYLLLTEDYRLLGSDDRYQYHIGYHAPRQVLRHEISAPMRYYDLGANYSYFRDVNTIESSYEYQTVHYIVYDLDHLIPRFPLNRSFYVASVSVNEKTAIRCYQCSQRPSEEKKNLCQNCSAIEKSYHKSSSLGTLTLYAIDIHRIDHINDPKTILWLIKNNDNFQLSQNNILHWVAATEYFEVFPYLLRLITITTSSLLKQIEEMLIAMSKNIYISIESYHPFQQLGNHYEKSLHFIENAIIHGNKMLVNHLKDLGANFKYHLDFFLIKAIESCQTQVVKQLLDFGVDSRANRSRSLITAIQKGFEEIAIILMKHSKVNIHIDQEYPLRLAVRNNMEEVVDYLINNGADIHAFHEGALRWACRFSSLSILKKLISAGANVHYQNDSILLTIVESSNKNDKYLTRNKIKLLIDAGVDVTINNNLAIKRAYKNGLKDICLLLTEYGASLDIFQLEDCSS